MTVKSVDLKLTVLLDDKHGNIEDQILNLGWSLEYNLPRHSDPLMYACKTECNQVIEYSKKLQELTENLNNKMEIHKIVQSAKHNSA